MGTLVNICGTGYCGSTMLDLMLGNGPGAFSCGEVSAWFRPYRKHHFKINCSCGQAPCPGWEKLKNSPADRFHATVIRKMAVDFVIDSSKDLCWVLDANKWAVLSDLKVFNVIIWKHPESLAYSHWKRGHEVATWHSAFLKYHSRFFQLGLPFVAVNYEDLVNTPSRILSRICEMIGMPYFEGKERFWQGYHHYLFGSGGIRKQVKSGSSKIRARREFPEDFQPHLKTVREQMADDSQIQQIISLLQQVDVSNNPHAESGEGSSPNSPYPVWYYVHRLKGLFHRFFPRSD
jgi:hypothetical protein